MAQLSDGSVIPSYLGVSHTGSGYQLQNLFNNVALRVGEVQKVYYPDDEQSVSKKFLEYKVQVYQRTNGDPGTSLTYNNCLVANLFGGGASDSFTYTLRSASKQIDNQTGFGNGSKVLLLCLDGETANAIIISGMLSSSLSAQESKDDGHNLDFNFNGINANINKDGELTLTFNGKTDNDGKVTGDDKASGSVMTFNKEGSVSLEHDDESIEIDYPNKQVHINSKSNTTIKSSGLLVGDATDAFMLGTTYRHAESTMNNTLSTALGSLNTALGAFAATMTAQGAAPVITGPQYAATGAAMAAALSAIGEAITAIQQFEAQAQSYLSTHNKND